MSLKPFHSQGNFYEKNKIRFIQKLYSSQIYTPRLGQISRLSRCIICPVFLHNDLVSYMLL